MSTDRSTKVWDEFEDGNGKVNKTLSCPGLGGMDDILVGCLWYNDFLITISLGVTTNIFSVNDLVKAPLSIFKYMKNITSLSVLNNVPKVI